MIQLIGPGGAGKTTVGAQLGSNLNCIFVDLDREFNSRLGDVDAFIAEHGYAGYARDTGRTTADRAEAVIRERFSRYAALPAAKVETLCSVEEATARIRAALRSNGANHEDW